MGCLLLAAAATAQTNVSINTRSTSSVNGTQTSSHRLSVKDSDTHYGLRANFDAQQHAALKKLLSQQLDAAYLSKDKKKTEWLKKEKGKIVYQVTLEATALKITVNKELLSKAAYERFENLGEQVGHVLSGK